MSSTVLNLLFELLGWFFFSNLALLSVDVRDYLRGLKLMNVEWDEAWNDK